ncbi:efflux RND transporter periplasmic adaptor subunit [Algoriphagus litoralis]|uniref:efflux RND transporter periplasmic adaptor subunit n=1 Tax=Algoriphagus litoralis TaxID=2202829 RepID=UPI001300323E|nr:efflux RND transporter periplasmic adaptor subunit [Algoriphagus litoralis]
MKKINQLLGSTLLAGILSCSSPETLQPETKSVMEAVYASGFLEAIGQVELRAQTEGVLQNKFGIDGEKVENGQVLFTISGLALDSRLQAAQLKFDLAKSNIDPSSPMMEEMVQGIKIAEEQYRADSLKWLRQSQLYEQKAVSLSQYESAKTAFESSKQSFKRSQSQLESKREQVLLDLESARKDLLQLQDELAFHQIRSDRDGILFQSLAEIGEFIKKGDVLATLGSSEGYIGNLKIDEQDIGKISLGQKVLLEMDAFPGKTFQAELAKIYSKVDPADQMLRVDVHLKDSLPKRLTGLALEANILIREKSDALVIPAGLLLPGDSVVIFKDGKVQKTKVSPGIRTLSEVEILEGLSNQSALIKP